MFIYQYENFKYVTKNEMKFMKKIKIHVLLTFKMHNETITTYIIGKKLNMQFETICILRRLQKLHRISRTRLD